MKDWSSTPVRFLLISLKIEHVADNVINAFDCASPIINYVLWDWLILKRNLRIYYRRGWPSSWMFWIYTYWKLKTTLSKRVCYSRWITFHLPVIMTLIKKVGPPQNYASPDSLPGLEENPGSAIARTRGNQQKESEMLSLLPSRVLLFQWQTSWFTKAQVLCLWAIFTTDPFYYFSQGMHTITYFTLVTLPAGSSTRRKERN